MKRLKITDKYIAFFDKDYKGEIVQVQIHYDEFVNLCKPSIEEYIRNNEKNIEKREKFPILREMQIDKCRGKSITYYKEPNDIEWKLADTTSYNNYIKPHLIEE